MASVFRVRGLLPPSPSARIAAYVGIDVWSAGVVLEDLEAQGFDLEQHTEREFLEMAYRAFRALDSVGAFSRPCITQT